MNLGTNEPKKVVMLGSLVVLAGYLVYSNLLSGPSQPTAAAGSVAVPRRVEVSAPPGSVTAAVDSTPTTTPRNIRRNRSDDFHPVLRSKRPEDRIDPTTVDPTLRRDLLAKLQAVSANSAERNPFQFGQAPPKELPKGPEPKVIPKPITPVTAVEPPKPPGPPPTPLITLKYYGYTSAKVGGAKTAFFLDGEDILVGREGDTLKRRYRLVRIGLTSVIMEDTESKHQQTIPLTEEVG
jgi:hypothetical protein